MTYYYVSIIDGARSGLVAGPWLTHEEALAQVESVRKYAQKVEIWSWFFSFGTASTQEKRASVLGNDPTKWLDK